MLICGEKKLTTLLHFFSENWIPDENGEKRKNGKIILQESRKGGWNVVNCSVHE